MPRPGEADALVRLVREAQDQALFGTYPLDPLLVAAQLWLEPDATRAKLTELYPTATEFGLAFVRPSQWVDERRPVVVPVTAGTTRMLPTVLCPLPEATIQALRAVPQSERLDALLLEELERRREFLDEDEGPEPVR